MDVWNEIREKYAEGGVTHRELAEQYGVPLGSLRRRAAAESWTALRSARHNADAQSDGSARHTRLARQLELTDRLLEIISTAMEDEDQLFYHVEFTKASSGSEYVVERLKALDDERLCRIVKAIGDIFELQRMALGIHEYKDEISARKVTQDGELASRKLDIELLKLEASQSADSEPDSFLDALGLCVPGAEGGEAAYEQP